ncbi:circumsporozoite protein-like [Carya illinoinensis]|uniref:circumsporozoite protein-like n=1 Tax=Carya illinoinensis TaxID=32201 RepID=UPI001C71A2D7|nr:circumsporozoite protein-like [Carya illinoinensis]
MAGPSRGRGGRRGFCGRRFEPYATRAHRPRGVRIAKYHSPPNEDHESGSDDSTQPPSHPWEPPCPISMPPPEPSREPSPVREPPPNGDNIALVVTPPNGDNIGTVVTPPNRENIDATAPTMPTSNMEQPKRKREPAKCIAFEMLRK